MKKIYWFFLCVTCTTYTNKLFEQSNYNIIMTRYFSFSLVFACYVIFTNNFHYIPWSKRRRISKSIIHFTIPVHLFIIGFSFSFPILLCRYTIYLFFFLFIIICVRWIFDRKTTLQNCTKYYVTVPLFSHIFFKFSCIEKYIFFFFSLITNFSTLLSYFFFL